MTIACPDHGAFRQNPANHIRDVGCQKCGDESGAEKRPRTTEDWVQEAIEVHGDRYDYSRAKYKTAHEKVEIGCGEHRSFWQSPPSRLNKTGCPGCALSGFDHTKPGLLYYLAVTTDGGGTLCKIGITNLSVNVRFPTLDLARIRVVKTWHFPVGGDAAEQETEILREFSRHRYYGPEVLEGSGHTELFTHDVLELDNKGSGQSAVDEEANLFSRPIQFDFGLVNPRSPRSTTTTLIKPVAVIQS